MTQTAAQKKHAGTAAFFTCVFGIYACYLTYGYVQEGLYVPQEDGSRFTFTWVLLAAQCFVNAAVGIAAHFISIATGAIDAPPKSAGSPWSASSQFGFATIAATYLLAMMCSNEAIKFVSYPTQALAKSCKMIPVMLARVFYLGKRYHWVKYVAVVGMAAGIAVFQLARIKHKPTAAKHDPEDEDASGALTMMGYGLLFASLVFDAVTGPRQEELQSKLHTSSVLFMALQNVYALLFAVVGSLVTAQLGPAVAYLTAHPHLNAQLLLFSITSALGQLFIFYTVLNFDSLVLTTVTTTRKFFTILVSVVAHGHALSPVQWAAVTMVFGAIGLDKFGPGLFGGDTVPPGKRDPLEPHAEETLEGDEHAGYVGEAHAASPKAKDSDASSTDEGPAHGLRAR